MSSLELGTIMIFIIYCRAAPSTGIGPIPALFGGIGIGKACYTSTNSAYMYYYNEFL